VRVDPVYEDIVEGCNVDLTELNDGWTGSTGGSGGRAMPRRQFASTPRM